MRLAGATEQMVDFFISPDRRGGDMGASEQRNDFIGIRATSQRRGGAPPTGATVSIYVAAAAIGGKFMKLHGGVGWGFYARAVFGPLELGAVVAWAATWRGLGGAEGAMGVGIARGGIARGYATGFAVNQPTVKAARANAVEQCRRTKSSNADAKSGCEVVVTFRNKCVASAVDPQSGTPGAGWGIGGSQQSADSQALARCRVKAGTERAEVCDVTDRDCDGDAK